MLSVMVSSSGPDRLFSRRFRGGEAGNDDDDKEYKAAVSSRGLRDQIARSPRHLSSSKTYVGRSRRYGLLRRSFFSACRVT